MFLGNKARSVHHDEEARHFVGSGTKDKFAVG